MLHDAGGTVPPMLAIAEALVARGHAVTVLGQPSIEQRARASGCGFVPFAGLPDYARDRPLEEQLDLVMSVMTGRQAGDDLLRVAEDTRAEVVVVDCNLAGAAAAAEAAALPSNVLLHSMYKTYVDTWFGELWRFMEPAINNTRSQLGLDPCNSWTDLFARHRRLYSAVPLAFDAPVSRAPGNIRHSGFLVPGATPIPAEVELARRAERVVLISLSTTDLNQHTLMQAILDSVEGMDLTAVVTTAEQIDRRRMRVPSNVAAVDFLPHATVLPHIDAVITHAGLGTVAAALSHGVPMVCTPIARDQPLNALRVATLGAGVIVPAAECTSQSVRDALDAVLTDPSYRSAAQRIRDESARAGGATGVALDLETMLRPG